MMNPRTAPAPQAYISSRKYIKWGDDPANETTSTLVLTTPQKHYADIRILLPLDPTNSALEWAFAGTSFSTPPTSDTPQHSKWTHWVDSKHPLGIEVQDEGDMYPQEDGSTLEYGEMVNPATGKVEKYEESWVDFDVENVRGEKGKRGWVMKTKADVSVEVRGMVIRVGQFIQGIVKRGGDIGIERWKYVDEGATWKIVKVGDGLGKGTVEAMIRADGHEGFEGLNNISKFTDGEDVDMSIWEFVEDFKW